MNLKEYIKKYYMVYRDHPVTLSSGGESKLYFDIKGLMMDNYGAAMVHNELSSLIEKTLENKYFKDSYHVGGMELGGALIVQFMVARGWEGFIVRKKQKVHGLQHRIEAGMSYQNNHNVVIVEDVITTGKTVQEVYDILYTNHNIWGTFCIIDRTGKDPSPYHSLYKEKDFL